MHGYRFQSAQIDYPDPPSPLVQRNAALANSRGYRVTRARALKHRSAELSGSIDHAIDEVAATCLPRVLSRRGWPKTPPRLAQLASRGVHI